MTVRQRAIVDTIKAALTPVLLTMVGFFLAGMYSNYRSMESAQQNLLLEFREYKAATTEKIINLERQLAEIKALK